MIWLDRVMPADRVVVCDVGGFMETPLRYLEVADPRAQVLPARFGAVGLGMGAAIGAGVADPRRPTLLVTGDGGWMMGGINGLDTAVREGLDLVVLVLNDGGYGIERRALEARGSPSEIASMPWPDPNEVAVALGGESLVVRSRADLEHAREAIENRARPLVLDARVF
jgi:thiamine pyrophosphate-dependent acetolactate synthase large subunit-like protein